ncbi:nitrate- and nitrite sensing domain-containing protein [Nonomuraea sp. LP-02]|uniref:sensor histidine kinase n=1 Tax=Nonomuraea sp. LP-02 TaxID=3097960 RepID=UPI002E33FD42|nr:nitrate- and nitrite sensing domain-containing protein [Nonomuraea sp. LP-02]MED7928390.1 nitrate- and nitrite sensing domain-containing protein [Nonomuraea sp. LP-02]
MASGRSIRFKISTLLVIPLVSLVALWGFAASTTAGEALNLLKVETIWTGVINNSDGLIGNLQKERLASAERIGNNVTDPDALAESRAKVDASRKRLTQSTAAEDVQAALTPDMKNQLQAVFSAIDRIPDIRRKVDERRVTPGSLVTEFGRISDEIHLLYARLNMSTDVELSLQAQGVIAADEVRELLSREHALIIASNGRATMHDLHMLAGLDGSRAYLFPKALANLDTELRAPFERIYYSPRYVTMENLVESTIGGQPLDIELWRGISTQVQDEYQEAVWRAGDRLLGRMEPAGIAIVVQAAVAGALGLVAVIVSIFISLRFGRRITRELAALRRTALDLAEIRLPDVVAKLRKGERVDIEAEAPPIRVSRNATSEVADLAAAFDSVQRTAVDAAVEQAHLREGLSEALRNLARRSQSLLQRQLKLLDEMQHQTEEPEALERLFKLDHLTTRMRRHAEGLVLLSGGSAGRRWRGIIPMEDVLSGAAAQVEEYTRVRVYPMPEAGVSGAAVADLMHLFAELIENAAAFSSPSNEVSVRGEMVGRGFAVEIEDRGLGMDEATRQTINCRLASPPEFDAAQTERLGFAVIGMLAVRHGIKVTLKPSPYGGTTAIVLVPGSLVEPLVTPPKALDFEPVSVSVVRTDGPASNGNAVNGGLPRRVHTSRRGPALPQPAQPMDDELGPRPSPDPAPPSPFGSSDDAPALSPFGADAPEDSPFRGGDAPEVSPFGGDTPEVSPFGGDAPATSPFGGDAAEVSLFRGGDASATSPFGGDTAEVSPFRNGGGPAVSPVRNGDGPAVLPRRARTNRPQPAEQAGPPQAADGRPPASLPRRQRQNGLSPRLKEAPPPEPAPAPERSPEEARALLSSLQSGWQRGRQDSDQDGGSQP